MNIVHYIFCILFIFLVVWMTKNPEHKKYQQWFAVILIYCNLGFAIYDHNDIIIVAQGFVAGYIAAINHYYKGFIGV